MEEPGAQAQALRHPELGALRRSFTRPLRPSAGLPGRFGAVALNLPQLLTGSGALWSAALPAPCSLSRARTSWLPGPSPASARVPLWRRAPGPALVCPGQGAPGGQGRRWPTPAFSATGAGVVARDPFYPFSSSWEYSWNNLAFE